MFSLSVVFDTCRTHTLHTALNSEAVMTTRGGLVVEEELLLITYKTRKGGRHPAGTENYLRATAEAILLAHNGGAGFTCNKRVTVNDIYGHGSDASPPVLAVIDDLDYQGAGKDIPPRVLHFLINRLVCCVIIRYS